MTAERILSAAPFSAAAVGNESVGGWHAPAGTIMTTAAGAGHAGYNVGFNAARSMNFSTPASIDYALVAQKPIDRLNANAGADANANANSRKDKGKQGQGQGKR